MTETELPSLSSLSLPAAALVIDMRGKKDDTIERLKIEFADLTREMQIQGIQRWRYLADFLSFLPAENCPIELMSSEDVRNLRAQSQPTETITQNIESIIDEISNIINNRRYAEADLSESTDRSNQQNTKTRIIFLTDARYSNSLVTTAAYTAYLRDYYQRHRHGGQLSMIDITVLCMNNSAEATPSLALKELLWRDGWDHLDQLILIDSNQNGVRIADSVQASLVELLIYVLLMVPNLKMDSSAPRPQIELSQNTNGQRINLPPTTFSIGLASMEHSTRWGRRFLNYQAVEQIIQVIHGDIQKEKTSATKMGEFWLNDNRKKIRKGVPNQIPANISGLKGISQANRVIQGPGKVLRAHTFGLIIGSYAVSNIREYLVKITRTYIGEAETTTSTLQDAINNIPRILLVLSGKENETPNSTKATLFSKVLAEAQRILSQEGFFLGARGAVPRGKLDLEELSEAIAQLETEHRQNPINLLSRQQQLAREVNSKLKTFQRHIERFPLLSSVWHLKQPMAWLTLVSTFCLFAIATVIGAAWLRHFMFLKLPDSAFLPIMTIALHPDISPVAYVFWGLISVVLFAGVYFLWRRFLNSKSSDLRVETLLCFSLIVFQFIEILIKPSIVQLATDSQSVSIIFWLSLPLSWVSIVSLSIFVLIIATELTYFIWWYVHLQGEGKLIVTHMNAEHKVNVEDVVTYIADSILLKLLSEAELTGGEGKPGKYYTRVSYLDTLLVEVLKHAQKQQNLAGKRLTQTIREEEQKAATRRLSLPIREELLTIASLISYSRLLPDQGDKELQEFSELLLRLMGKETPSEIVQEFKTRPVARANPEQHDQQVLMASLVAITLRFCTILLTISTSPTDLTTSKFSNDLTEELGGLIKQLDELKNHSVSLPPAMKLLIDTLGEKLSIRMFHHPTNESAQSIQTEMHVLATDTLAAWGQMFWEDKTPELNSILALEGVIPKILAISGDEQEVKKKLLDRIKRFYSLDQRGKLYLLLPLSQQSKRFRQNLTLPEQNIIDFPDVERLVLLYTEYYVAES